MIQCARQETLRPTVRFTGIDLFETRPADQATLSLKRAYQLLHAPDVRGRLVPGDPFAALARTSNTLANTDLVVIRASQLGEAMERAWFYLPRMLHHQSLVLVERPTSDGYDVLDHHSVQQRAAAALPRRRAA
jgi:hypothetical protein